jgi:tetratricopeptide (TPR) repeat protein
MDARASRVPVPKAAKPERERTLDDAEVHLMMARIRPWDSRESILAAGRELADARALAGDHPTAELFYWSGLYAARWRHYEEAERDLRRAIALEPSRTRHWLALAQVLSHDESPGAVAQLEEAVARLLPLARSAQALNFIALYYSQRGLVDAGLPYAQRAVATEHSCWECAETLAMLQNLTHSSSGPQPDGDKMYTKPSIR